MIIKSRPSSDHPDYSAACRQTVTLYNVYTEAGAKKYHKTVFNAAAFLESKKVFQEGRTGVTASNSALLVIPQGADGKRYVDPVTFDASTDKSNLFTLRNGDKAMPGVGSDVSTATEWADLIAAKAPGVVVVAAVDPKRNLAGEIVHVEAGG